MILVVFALVLWSSSAWAATVWVDPTAPCTGGTYSATNRDCTGSNGNSYTTPLAAVTAAALGDTIYFRTATYSTSATCGNHNCVIPLKASSPTSARVTIECYPGDTCTIAPVGNTYVLQRGASRDNHTIKGFRMVGTNAAEDFGILMNNGEDGLWLLDNEITDFQVSAVFIIGNDVIIRGNHIHDLRSDCAPGNRYYGIYFNSGARGLIQHNEIYNTPGGAIQSYPGDTIPITDHVIDGNDFHDNNQCSTSDLVVLIGRNNHGAKITNNIFRFNGSHVNSGATSAITTFGGAGNTQIVGNTFFGNRGYSIMVRAGSSGTQIKNNWGGLDLAGFLNDLGTGTVVDGNITNGLHEACFVDAITEDFRLKQGTNACRNTGVAHATRPAAIGLPDVGAYEQGLVSSAVVVDGSIEVTMSVMTPGVTPASGITGFSVTCVGCTGTPVVTASLKAGSNNIVLLDITGIASPGSCTLTLGTTNLTDSYRVGPTWGLAQWPNSVSAMAVTGTCDNSGSVSAPTNMIAHYTFDASNADDQTINNNDGTVSPGVTYVTGFSGLAASIPTESTYNHILTPVGAGWNPSTKSFGKCVLVLPDLTYAQKVVFSSSGNGTNQRWYAGWVTIGGVKQWGIGIGSSGFASTGSEFLATEAWTLVCIQNDDVANTATLWVNGIKGASVGNSVKTVTSYTLVGNLRTGNDGTFTTNNGGFQVDGDWTWDIKPTDADIQNLYASIFPTPTPLAGYLQKTHQAEGVYLSARGGSPVSIGSAAGTYKVVANGAIALLFQFDCVGGECGTVAFRPYCSLDGVTFDFAIPDAIGSCGLAMYGDSIDPVINMGVATCCLTGALTPNNGTTVMNSVITPSMTLSENHSQTFRIIVRVGNIAGQTRYIKWKQDNGAELDGGYTPSTGARIDVITPQASAGF